jgi:hypothetical protein
MILLSRCQVILAARRRVRLELKIPTKELLVGDFVFKGVRVGTLTNRTEFILLIL